MPVIIKPRFYFFIKCGKLSAENYVQRYPTVSSKDKTWTAGTLKSRGWTEELFSALLPPAQRRYFSGRRVRVWRIEDVKRAEQTEAFKAGRVKAVSAAPMPGRMRPVRY